MAETKPPFNDPAGLLDRAPELLDLALADRSVRGRLERGDAHGVYRAIWWGRLLGRLKAHRSTVDALLAHRQIFVTPLRRMPVLSTMNGVGASVYGASSRETDGSYIKTHFLVFAFVPVFPLAQYLVKDADQGWFFLGKVPPSTPVRIWNRLVVFGLLLGVLGGVYQAMYASRYHDVHVVNGLPWPVHVTVGGVAYDVPANAHRVGSVRTGDQPVQVTGPKGQPVESGTLQVEAGTDLQMWNVLGAAPLFDRTVVYQDANGKAPEPEPQFFCGERAIRRSGITNAFSDPPQSIKMSSGQTVGYRRQVGVLPEGLEYCASRIGRAGKPEPALALAKGLMAFDPDPAQTRIAAGLCRAVDRDDEGLRLTEQALARHPDSVEHHRLYQSLAETLGKGGELRAAYKARFEASPDSPDAAYLYARVLPDPEAMAMVTPFLLRFPDHIGLLRMQVFRSVRNLLFVEALDALERLRRLDRQEWGAHYVEDHLTVLAGLGRGDEAMRVAEEAFARKEGSQFRLAGMEAWLSRRPGAPAETLIAKMALAPNEAQELRVHFWLVGEKTDLAPLRAEPGWAMSQLMLHAHYDPRKALEDAARAGPDALRQVDAVVLILLLGEARADRDAEARKRLEAALEPYVPVPEVRRYFDDGSWSEALDKVGLAERGALSLARSRNERLPSQERERLRAHAGLRDPLGGYVQMALAGWPTP